MAIPYLDVNPKGSGYYSIAQRPFAYLMFQFGFLQVWILLTLVGTLFRGPNWRFFGLYEARDLHQVSPPDVMPLPEPLGLLIAAAYSLGLPPLFARTLMRDFRNRMGWVRFTIMVALLLAMVALPLTMLLQWTLRVG